MKFKTNFPLVYSRTWNLHLTLKAMDINTETFKPVRKYVLENLNDFQVGINESSYVYKILDVNIQYRFHFNYKEPFSVNFGPWTTF